MAKKPTPRSRILRHLSQGAFAAFILVTSVLHYLVESEHMASIDAYCPFGGFETLWRWITTGTYVSKTHGSNLILALGLLVGTLLAGGAFCGWVCPFGALQELLAKVRQWLHLPQIKVPAKLDRWLGYGRYVVLGGILYATISTVKLWFAGYDPYRTIFGLGWLFEFNLAESWPAYLVALLVVVAALLIPRFWCRYACPLGGLISLLQRISFLRIRRNEKVCINCNLCTKACPSRLPVATAKTVTAGCIGCLECVEACPKAGALDVTTVQLLPTAEPKERVA